ncbi:hypothetical protein [Pseudoroseicyclus tamaricis]|uniref:YnbE-like lipoprotein n=1 Tax=Pseudoroseicyclus tamaricis TaxID=2705421 RepID=A0A6B2JZ97_9RHOB|nr:hypothetical protein [Pseudoroseicyclus tamaricis]NDV01594.1 hypothetical protein [Pseudoroseicyclus tamaricis]
MRSTLLLILALSGCSELTGGMGGGPDLPTVAVEIDLQDVDISIESLKLRLLLTPEELRSLQEALRSGG